MKRQGDSTSLPPAYWRLWAAAAISNLGDGVFIVALPLLAARVTDDRLSIGLIATFFSIPWLLFAIPVGVLIDRSDRRWVMVSADLCRAALVGGIAAVAAFTDVQIWMLWLLAFGLGTGEVFFDSTSQTLLPAVVPAEGLERANGYFSAAEVVTNNFLGMPLGSTLFGFFVWLPFGLDAATFVAAAALAASLRGTFRARTTSADPASPGTTPHESALTSLRQGLHWIARHSLLRMLALSAGLGNLAYGTTQATLVLFALEEMHLSERMFGVALAIVGGGSLVAGLLGGRMVEHWGRRPVVFVAAVLPIITCASIGAFPNGWNAVPMYALLAASSTTFTIITVSLRQQLIPDQLLGRVNSVYRWVSAGAMALGALFGAVLAEAYGLRVPYFVAAGILVVAALGVVTTFSGERVERALSQMAETPR